MKEIKLTQGKVALVDDEDYERVSALKWQARKTRSARNYYAYHAWKEEGRVRHISMHRLILAAPIGADVDHRDGDGLNNRRSNIRLCTPTQNEMNKKPSSRNTSGYKGVSHYNKGPKWMAKLKVGNRKIRRFGFTSAEEAARAYDALAIEHYGEFAMTNFQQEDTDQCSIR